MPCILAIDDNQDNLVTISVLLKLLIPNSDVITASSGEEGIHKAIIERPDTILLDIHMPGMDGFETCRELKKIEATAFIPVIMLTAVRTDSKSRVRALDIGADAFLTKPIDEAALAAQVRAMLRIKKAEDRLRDENAHLEELVKERVADLSQANAQLVREMEERKQAEQEKKKLEQQLIHAQKLESVGRLAGGIAHEFNNMLSIILGYSEMMQEDMTRTDPNYPKVIEISAAAKRSADLTEQLLAFARKQTACPRILDLNETVSRMMNMLRRLLREDIRLNFLPHDDPGLVKIDPIQLDQILVNLCINAGDAINGAGQISIATEHVTIDEPQFEQDSDLPAGRYVKLSVRDTGCGMDKNIIPNIFEPFFTTKESAHGSGLGLSTVYGIVRQNNGSLYVSSEPGKGSTFTILLPEHKKPDGPDASDCDHKVPDRKNATILLVEDEKALLDLGRQMLEQMGYSVLWTHSPKEALDIAAGHPDQIQLLITDVIMPEMNGYDLAVALKKKHPHIQCLYVSGYPEEVLSANKILEEGTHFLPKPYRKEDLKRVLENFF
ncbi:response regulator [uncultured Desulfobacter sp.]|uniref:response regulator n=1 Tax=uncultured Desulfobacter sp. TaxID=240139 RepID=UPI002AAB1511|nr:response regulator [uncultured Desulfobacter sp.]